ncbi:hypothetical protein [Micromonospora sp. DT62]|uniref:hypothetical protein n=1 Tax=Micromonospora sp. DT62 TaxID=3416521 RepID=UPI003CE9F202
MVMQDRLAIVDGLLTLPFPGKNTRKGCQSSGPGFHVYVPQASRSFWDDRSEEIVEAAQAEIDTAFQALATVLAEPMNQLCQLSGQMCVWRSLGAGRWVALAVGQGDPELPLELLLTVGEADPFYPFQLLA